MSQDRRQIHTARLDATRRSSRDGRRELAKTVFQDYSKMATVHSESSRPWVNSLIVLSIRLLFIGFLAYSIIFVRQQLLFFGLISWGRSGPLCHALSLSSSALSWTSMRRRRATVPLSTSGELAWGGSQWWMGPTFFKCCLFLQETLALFISSFTAGSSPGGQQTLSRGRRFHCPVFHIYKTWQLS